MTWAKIVAGLLSLIKPLVYAIVYLMGKRAARAEVERDQRELEGKVRKEYERIEQEDRDTWLKQ